MEDRKKLANLDQAQPLPTSLGQHQPLGPIQVQSSNAPQDQARGHTQNQTHESVKDRPQYDTHDRYQHGDQSFKQSADHPQYQFQAQPQNYPPVGGLSKTAEFTGVAGCSVCVRNAYLKQKIRELEAKRAKELEAKRQKELEAMKKEEREPKHKNDKRKKEEKDPLLDAILKLKDEFLAEHRLLEGMFSPYISRQK